MSTSIPAVTSPPTDKDPPLFEPSSSQDAKAMPPPSRPRPSTSNTNLQAQPETREEIVEPSGPSAFAPFFVLVNDIATKSTFHPRNVHYLFSDDDTEVLTNALIHSSAEQNKGEAEQRVLILDINETGEAVSKATSLSSAWQVLGAEVEKAPSLEGGEGEGGMMVRIEGVGDEVGDVEEETEEEMVERFEGRMEVLRGLVGMEMEQDRGGEGSGDVVEGKKRIPIGEGNEVGEG